MRFTSLGAACLVVALAVGCDGPAVGADAAIDGAIPRRDGETPRPDGQVDGDGGLDPDDGGLDPDGGVGPVVPDADPTFGAGGVALVNVDELSPSAIWSVVVQPDGRILAGGRTAEALVVVRARPDGSLDRSFGHDGLAVAPIGWQLSSPQLVAGIGTIALAPDGTILASGLMPAIGRLTQHEVIVRFTAGGAIDRTFGTDGYVVGDYAVPEGARANAVAVQDDGRVIVAAHGHVDRLMPDGSPDPSFGSGGRFLSTLVPSGGVFADYQGVAIDDEGRIVLSGMQSTIGTGLRIAVARLTPAGLLDTTFGGGAGYVLDSSVGTGFAPPTKARSVALSPDGHIVVGGMRTPSSQLLSIGRFAADGTLDTSFGAAGWASAPDGVSYVGSTAAVALQPGGALVGLGGAGVGGSPAQLVRFTSAGALDTTFGDEGVGGFSPYDAAFGLGLQGDGAVIVAGQLRASGAALQRFDAGGALDATFAEGGVLDVHTDGGYDRVFAIVTQPDDRILIGGTASAWNLAGLARLMPDGSLDESFGTAGRVAALGPVPQLARLDAVTAIALDASERILVGGPSSSLRVWRLTPDGRADSTYGSASDFAEGPTQGATMVVGLDGSVYVLGHADGATGDFFGVKRLLEDGTGDPSFGTGGQVVVPVPSVLRHHAVAAVQPDGRIVASGGALVRIDPDGTLDPTFGTGGVIAGNRAHGIAFAAGGAIVLATVTGSGAEAGELTVERRLADGSLDPSFGVGGVARAPLGTIGPVLLGVGAPIGLSIESDGSIVVATTSSAEGEEGRVERATLLRFASDGTLDPSFGSGGRRVLALGPGSSALHAIATQPDGATLLAGRAIGRATGSSDFMVLRLR